MNDMTFAAIKEAELKKKQELIDFVTEKIDDAFAALTERQNQIIARLLEIEKRIMRLEGKFGEDGLPKYDVFIYYKERKEEGGNDGKG